MTVVEMIEVIRGTPNCEVQQSAGLPEIPVGMSIPADVRLFYAECGGVSLFSGADYPMELVPPSDFTRANPVIVDDPCEEDRSFDWFIVGRSGLQYVTIDLFPARLGRCYDSFWDRHGLVGDCPVVAMTFSELLVRLIESKGGYWYWLQESFHGYGDAYD